MKSLLQLIAKLRIEGQMKKEDEQLNKLQAAGNDVVSLLNERGLTPIEMLLVITALYTSMAQALGVVDPVGMLASKMKDNKGRN